MSKNNVLLCFTDEDEKWISQKADDAFDFKEIFSDKPLLGAISEKADGPVSHLAIHYVNKVASPFIPDEYKDEIQGAMADIRDGDKDYTLASENMFSILEQVENKALSEKPKVREAVKLFTSFAKIAVNSWLEKVAEEDVDENEK